jgi:hypothetical protein
MTQLDRFGAVHISHLCHDHIDAGWTGRMPAWQHVLDLLSGALDQVRASTEPGDVTCQ